MRKDSRGLIILIAVFLLAAILIPLSCPGRGSGETEPTTESSQPRSSSTTRVTTSPRTLPTTTTVTSEPLSEPVTEPTEEAGPSLEEIFEAVAPSVVSVHVTIPASSLYSKREEFFSGLIVDESGIVVTSYSPLERALDYKGALLEGASIRIYTRPSNEVFSASLLGFHSLADLALLKIKEGDEGVFPALPLAKSPELAVGTLIYAIGYPPFMVREGGLSIGYVTSLYRTSFEEDGSPIGLLETSIPTLPVYAGCPLVNQEGQVVALTSGYLKRIYAQNQGFAIPSPLVSDVVERILAQPEQRPDPKAELGITVLGDEDAEELRERFGYPAGLYINHVKPESAAYTAGLDTDDILLSINGESMEVTRDFLTFMDGQTVGTLIEMTVYRPSDERTLVKSCYLLEASP